MARTSARFSCASTLQLVDIDLGFPSTVWPGCVLGVAVQTSTLTSAGAWAQQAAPNKGRDTQVCQHAHVQWGDVNEASAWRVRVNEASRSICISIVCDPALKIFLSAQGATPKPP